MQFDESVFDVSGLRRRVERDRERRSEPTASDEQAIVTMINKIREWTYLRSRRRHGSFHVLDALERKKLSKDERNALKGDLRASEDVVSLVVELGEIIATVNTVDGPQSSYNSDNAVPIHRLCKIALKDPNVVAFVNDTIKNGVVEHDATVRTVHSIYTSAKKRGDGYPPVVNWARLALDLNQVRKGHFDTVRTIWHRQATTRESWRELYEQAGV